MLRVLKLAAILAAYCLGAGALLAFVYLKTAPVIELHKQAASGDSVMAEVLPGMEGGFEKKGKEGGFIYFVAYKDAARKQPGGYIFIAKGQGYSSVIETMVGVDADLNIVGMKVLAQQETPGLGDKILQVKPGEETPWFTDQFTGKSLEDNIDLVDNGGVIDAISGATISSNALTSSVATGLSNLEASLAGQEVVVEEVEAPEEEEKEPAPLMLPADDELAAVVNGADGGFNVTGEGTEFPYWTGYSDDAKTDVAGTAFVSRAEGFASTIQLLVGIDTNGVITGIKTLSQDETPGYGTQMEDIRDGEDEPWFTRQFIGKSAESTIALTAEGGDIDALSGATISSNAVVAAVKQGLTDIKDALAGKVFPPQAVPPVLPEDRLAPEPETAPVQTGDDDLAEVLPGMDGGYEPVGEGTAFPYWTGYSDAGKKTVGGYVFIAREKGFQSTIETMVGVDTDGVITGVNVLSQDETPGYGTKIVEEPDFMKQFPGKTFDDVALSESGGAIDAITGATITSKAVIASISDGLDTIGKVMSGEEIPEEPEAPAGPEQQLVDVLPGMTGGYVKTEDADGFTWWTGYRDNAQTNPGGYVFIARGDGFASTIETLVGVDQDGTIVGMNILSQDETPGYGTRIIEEPDFIDQFLGKSADGIALSDNGGKIDALTGATITSSAVTESVAEGYNTLHVKVYGEKETAGTAAEQVPFDLPDYIPDDDQLAWLLPMMDGGYYIHMPEPDFYCWTGFRDEACTEVGGYLYLARGKGFASVITTLVAVNIDGGIMDIQVLSQDETPGYGDKIIQLKERERVPWFLLQFIGTSAPDEIKLKSDGGALDAVSGATVTSMAVIDAVRTGLTKLMDAVNSGKLAVTPVIHAPEPVDPDETTASALPEMPGGFRQVDPGSTFPYWVGYLDESQNEIGGYIFIASGKGFASTVETAVGVGPDGAIVGTVVISQNETPGYGTKIVDEPPFMEQFIGIAAPESASLSSDGGEIDAITGATITSKAVSASIRKGLEKLREKVVTFSK